MIAKGEPIYHTKEELKKTPELAIFDGARAIQGFDDVGHMVFTYVDKYGIPFKNKDGNNMTIAKEDFNTLFIPAATVARASFDGLINTDVIQKNYKYGTEQYKNLVKKTVNEEIKDKNTFLDIAFYHTSGSNGPLADSLNGIEYGDEGVSSVKETKMFTVLMDAIGGISTDEKNKLDINEDGKFTEADYATQENLDALIKKVLSGENLQLGKSLLIQYNNLQVDSIAENAITANTVVDDIDETVAIDEIVKKANK